MNEVEMREKKARELHANGCNCCQSVVLAFADKLHLKEADLMNLTQPFGRGMMGMKQTCGCVTAMAMVCGLKGQSMMFKGLANQFNEANGELNCPKLLQMQGAGHSCNDLVGCAAKLLADVIDD